MTHASCACARSEAETRKVINIFLGSSFAWGLIIWGLWVEGGSGRELSKETRVDFAAMDSGDPQWSQSTRESSDLNQPEAPWKPKTPEP